MKRPYLDSEIVIVSLTQMTRVPNIELRVSQGRAVAPMDFKLGDKVVYPNHGVGVIEQISYGYMNGKSEKYYMLRIVSSGLKVMVPQTNIDSVGLRAVIR